MFTVFCLGQLWNFTFSVKEKCWQVDQQCSTCVSCPVSEKKTGIQLTASPFEKNLNSMYGASKATI